MYFIRQEQLLLVLLLDFQKVSQGERQRENVITHSLCILAIGGPRNWDYRYAWIRDSSFTIYAFLRLGFTKEAGQFMKYIEDRCSGLVYKITE